MTAYTKKLFAALTASVTALGTCSALPVTAAEQEKILLQAEAEDLTITEGGQATTKVYNDEYPGYTGTGFVWAGNSGGVKFDVDLTEGAMYTLNTRVYSYLGDRLQNIAVDGVQVASQSLANKNDWYDVSWGSFYLDKGKHTVEVGSSGSWGFCLWDSVTFGYADTPDLKIDPTPVDKKATAETKALMKYLTDNYGKKIITGQQEIYGGGNDGDSELEFEYIYNLTGHYPAIRAFDFMNYNPLYGWEDGTTGRAIQWVAQRGGIATASWHINVPIDFENYTLGEAVDWQKCTYKNYQASNSTFNTANILKKDTKERKYFDAAVKMLAEQLLLLQDAKVPIILRPLHEAQGNYGRFGDGTSWFWWGDRGPEVYKELWKLLYTELTETYGVHNCLFEINLYELDNSAEWYPGNEYVDMIAYDKYEGSPYRWEMDPATSVFLTLVSDSDDTKMVALAECDKIPDITGMRNQGAWWSYICPWYGEFCMSEQYNTKDYMKEYYGDKDTVKLDDLPDDLYGYKRGNGGSWDVKGAYECEDGTLSRSAGTEVVEYKFCSGSGYVFLKNTDTANDSIEQTVTVDKAGTYALVWGYQQQYAEAGKTEHLFVNGKEVGDGILFPHSIMFTESEPVTVELNAGKNTVKLETGEGWIYFDYLLVREPGAQETTAPPAETTTVPQTAEKGLPGDVDDNGDVNVADAVKLARYNAEDKEITVTAQGIANADLNGDTKLTAEDLTILLNMLANLA